MGRDLIILDTTFRDGAQRIGAEITNTADALKAITAISGLGVSYLELGFANSHNGAQELIRQALTLGLEAKIAAFGRTHPDDVRNIIKLKVPVGVLVGKTRLREVEKSLRKDPEAYLLTIRNSVKTLVEAGLEVIFDAEHAFAACLNDDVNYAHRVLITAFEAGANWIVLCDTNGGINFREAEQVITEVSKIIPLDRFGVHFHNDRGRASCLSELAWELGISHIQGTIGTIGERTGNAAITTFLPNLILEKREANNFLPESLQKLCSIYLLICQALNIKPNPFEPWVGENAFATEAGMHADGLEKDPGSYFHANPEVVGNREKIGLSEKSGTTSLLKIARELGLSIPRAEAKELMASLKLLIGQGKNLGLARASLYLWLLTRLKKLPPLPEFQRLRVWDEKIGQQPIHSEASLKIVVCGEEMLFNAEGEGGVDALNQALRRILLPHFPFLKKVRLADFRPEIFHLELGTAAKVRITATFTNERESWTVMGVNADFLEAAWQALWDAYCYRLVKEKEKEEK